MKKLYFGDIHFLLPAQKDGDWARLAGWIEAGAPVTLDMRKFIGAVLRGELKQHPKHRAHDADVLWRDLEIAAYALKRKCVLAREGRLGKRWAGRAPKLDPKRTRVLEQNTEALRKERLKDLKNAEKLKEEARKRGADVVDVHVLDIETAKPERSLHIQQTPVQETMEHFRFLEPAPVYSAIKKFPGLMAEEDADLVLAAAARRGSYSK